MALCGHAPFGQRPVRKLWEFERLAIFVERQPNLGEVVQVASQAVTTRGPFERMRFEGRLGSLVLTPCRVGATMIPTWTIPLPNHPTLNPGKVWLKYLQCLGRYQQ